MDKIPRNLALAGCLLDLGALLAFVLMVDDAFDNGGELMAAATLLAMGVATLAIIGAGMILAALVLWAIERSVRHLEDRAASYADGLVDGVREGVAGVVGHLAKAIPPHGTNVRVLHPSRGHRPGN